MKPHISAVAPRTLPKPKGFSYAMEVKQGRVVFVAGQVAMDAAGAIVGRGDLVAQFKQTCANLQAVIAASLEMRRANLPTAEQLIGSETERYWEWVAGLAAVPVVTDLRAQMDRVRAREVAEAMKRLGHLSEADRSTIERLSVSIMNKFLHEPSVRLKSAAA